MAVLAAGRAVASAVLHTPACERLIHTGLEEYALVRGVEEEIEKLRSTAGIIKAVLRDDEGKQAGSELVRAWLSSLKQILFDARDALDEVATDAAALGRRGRGLVWTSGVGAKVRNVICCCFGTAHDFLADHGVADRIKHIRERVGAQSTEIGELGVERLGGGGMSEFSRPRRPPTSSLPTDGGDIIGRDDEKRSLEELLLADGTEGTGSNNVHVITVTGMGGIGKTTLVKLVYNSPPVKQHFHPTLIWVCVSNDFDLERISREIMDAIPSSYKGEEPRKITNWDKTQISIKEKIEGKRFLLVLYNMWEENDHAKWESLCKTLRYGGNGSKILVTARSVAHMVRGTHIPLAILSSENLLTAQNFIHVPKGSHADQSAMNKNSVDLLHTSFFDQCSEEDFVMHDLIHDLAETVSQDDNFKVVQNDRNERIPETVRHVSIVTDSFDPMRLGELCKLRTLLFLHPCEFVDLNLDALFMKFKWLLVLSLRWCKIKELPESIGTLIHLCYVDLSNTLITMLPESICNLHNLQELIVTGGKLKELAHMGILRQLQIRRLEEVTSKEQALQARLEDKVHPEVLELNWSDDRPYQDPSLLRDQEVADALQPVNSIRELLVKNYGGISSPRWMEGL